MNDTLRPALLAALAWLIGAPEATAQVVPSERRVTDPARQQERVVSPASSGKGGLKLPRTVDVPQLSLQGKQFKLPHTVSVVPLTIVGQQLTLPRTVEVQTLSLSGTRLTLPLVVSLPPLSLQGTFKP